MCIYIYIYISLSIYIHIYIYVCIYIYIYDVLEKDEFFVRAKRIEIPASITACGFYQKLGYTYKNEIDTVDAEGLYRLEKFNV